MTAIRTILVTSVIVCATGCADDAARVPQGLNLSEHTDVRVDGSYADGSDWIRFTAWIDEGGNSEVIIKGADGVLFRTINTEFVRFGPIDIQGGNDVWLRTMGPALEEVLASAEAELTARLFRDIVEPEGGAGEALAALSAVSNSVEVGIYGEAGPEEPTDVRACWNKCCGTDCDCYHYNPCSWWDPTCNYCANHDACIHYYRDHLGWSNAVATVWCT